ncbi:hypothetical protein BIW11_09207 [Tropilaelaps mercedesae]|uniref:RING-type domain-containing protein n=1 Tax=Tropilaelaps mercedesae TaxID=418985 RepID=A0A1V9XLA5_9ACAR|nr:hypothetical protein BIW11_09207 [Tropilaelaps mercedesae]
MSEGCTGGCRPSLVSVNPSLTCALCKGYLVNAMTLIRCMHSFCKSCIHRHLDTSSTCPTCQQRVFRSRMDLYMVADTTLQSVVYKTVPGLFANEMRRRWDFYEQNEDSLCAIRDKELRNEAPGIPLKQIFTEKDCISLALEHRQEEVEAPKFLNMYLSCPADAPIWVIIKFIRTKLSPPASLNVHLHLETLNVNMSKLSSKAVIKDSKESNEDKNKDRLLLDPDLTLIDVCYIADYKFEGPLKLSFKFVQFDPTLNSEVQTVYEALKPLESKSKGKVGSKQQGVNGKQVVIANGGVLSSGNNVQYGKYKIDTKSIDMARATLLNGGVSTSKAGSSTGTSKRRTYSRAGGVGAMVPPGQIGQLPHLKPLALTPGVLEHCANETTGDSTEEEEADNWDSNVSTTIDRTLTTQQQQQNSAVIQTSSTYNDNQSNNKQQPTQQQQQQSQPVANGNANNSNISSERNPCRTAQYPSSQNTTKRSETSIGNSPNLSSNEAHTQVSNGLSSPTTTQQQKKSQSFVTRPQTLKVTTSQVSVDAAISQKPHQAQPAAVRNPHSTIGNKAAPLIDKDRILAGKQTITPVIQQSLPVSHHKANQGHRNNHKNSTIGSATLSNFSGSSSTHHHHHGHHGGTHKSGHVGPSLVLSPTTASASTVAGKPPTVLKIKLNTSPTTCETLTITSPPLRDNRHITPEYPAVTSIKIKPIVAPSSGPLMRKSPSPPTSTRDTRGSTIDGRKKRKSDEDKKHQASSDEKRPKKAKSKKGSSSQALINDAAFVSEQATDLLGSQNFGWGSAALLWESQLRIPSPLTVPFTVSFARRQATQLKEREKAEKNNLQKDDAQKASRTDQDHFLETNFQLSKQPVVSKQPQNRIWRMRRQVSPPPPQFKLPPPDFVMSSTLKSVLKAIVDDKACDEDPMSIASTSDPSASLDVCNSEYPNDACRMQSGSEMFFGPTRLGSSSSGDINADVFRMEFPVAAVERDSPANLLTSASAASLCPAERSQSFSILSPSGPLEKSTEVRRRHSSSSPEVKFSISSILSDVGDQRKEATLTDAATEYKQPNVQETIEVCITNLSRFFWALETCSERIRCRLAEVCLFKRPVLEKILAIVRKLTIVVAPNQIERVLQLESAVEKYFLEPPASPEPSASLLSQPEEVINTELFLSGNHGGSYLRQENPLKKLETKGLSQRDKEFSETKLEIKDHKGKNVKYAKSCISSVINPNATNAQNLKSETAVIETKDVVEVKYELDEVEKTSKTQMGDNSGPCNEAKVFRNPHVKSTELSEVTETSTLSSEKAPKRKINKASVDQVLEIQERKPVIDDIVSEVSSKLNDVITEVTKLAEAELLDNGSARRTAASLLEKEFCTLDEQRKSVWKPALNTASNPIATEMEVDACSTSDVIPFVERVKYAIEKEITTAVQLPSTKVFTVSIKNPYGFPGSFGYNMCKSLVPYAPRPLSTGVHYSGSQALISSLNAATIPCFLERPLTIPLIRVGFEAISTCAPRPPLSEGSMELVLYKHRSSDIIEHLFHLAGLIPDRVPIPLQVHDYILKACPSYTTVQTTSTDRKRPLASEEARVDVEDDSGEDHPLFELIKRRALEVPTPPNTSPTFGDLGDMDVHRWEEVGVQGVQTPVSLGNSLAGGLNVH